MHGAVAAGLAAAGQENGNGRQARRDLIFTHISVPGPARFSAGGAGVPVAVRERLARQYGCAADALAWCVFGFQRGHIIVLCRNEPPGVMAGKAGSQLSLILPTRRGRRTADSRPARPDELPPDLLQSAMTTFPWAWPSS